MRGIGPRCPSLYITESSLLPGGSDGMEEQMNEIMIGQVSCGQMRRLSPPFYPALAPLPSAAACTSAGGELWPFGVEVLPNTRVEMPSAAPRSRSTNRVVA